MKRRVFLASLAAAMAGTALLTTIDAEAGPVRRHRRRHRRRVRRRWARRRYRRVAFTRVVLGRPFWVVPLGVAVGWELAHENRVVVVKEVRVVERDGAKHEVAVVQEGNGKLEEIDIVREDNARNAKPLEGSILPDNDTTTPGEKAEVEEEVEG